ncbi:MAG TPA: hypothetical protein VKE94_12220 [Gemmataceae bacterium]|nr:hypothetical protein [Gemmataceae bacterium]
MSQSEMTPLETALAALDPRPAALDRDRLMYLAGQRSAARRRWALPCVSAALASAATLLVVLLLYRPETQFVKVPAPAVQPSQKSSPGVDGSHVVGGLITRPAVPVVAASQESSAVVVLSEDRWRERVEALRLRNEVLLRGVEALPAPAGPGERREPISIDSLLR